MRIIYWLVAAIACLNAVSFAFDLHCSSVDEIDNYFSGAKPYACTVAALNITEKGVEMTSAALVLTIDRIEALIIDSQIVHHMPTFSPSFASKLKCLAVNYCHLKSISSNDLRQFPSLKNLHLIGNDLESLESNLFDFTPKLQYIEFSYNKLKSVGENILRPLKNFGWGRFYSAGCIAFSGNTILKLKLWADCKLPEFVDSLVSCNNISNDRLVCRTVNLQIENPKVVIKNLEGLSADQSPEHVTELIIEGQVVNFLPHQLAQTFTKLQKLVVFHSQLNSLLKNDFRGLADLKWIEITNNNIKFIDVQTFNDASQIEHLDLSSNHIRSLPTKIFSSLTSLQGLRLSFNEIKILNADILPPTNAIAIFRIDSNKLEVIDANIVVGLENSYEINFSNNTCVDMKHHKTDDHSGKNFNLLLAMVMAQCAAK